jgi:hypothetical protein
MDALPANLQTHMSPLQENVNDAAQPHVSTRRARPLRLSAARRLGDLRLSSESTLMPRLTLDDIFVLNVARFHSFQTSLLTYLQTHDHLATKSTLFRHNTHAFGGAYTLHNGARKKMEEQAELHARNPQEQKEAGLGQLVICVGGIYASL